MQQLYGVIEGFYGQPWTFAQRLALFQWMEKFGLNCYFYAPKDDLKHRAGWRLRYDEHELTGMGRLIAAAHARDIEFGYGMAPGLDIRYSDPHEFDYLRAKLDQLAELECSFFGLLFDDIPVEMDPQDRERFGTLAEAQAQVANELYDHLRSRTKSLRMIFCPTVYCDAMAAPSLHENDYLRTIGARLHPEIDLFWTGPDIISERIGSADVTPIAEVLGRPPLLWDNLHANDYDMARLYMGPYSGRERELRVSTKGILSNPNCEFEANFIPLRTFGEWCHETDGWNPRRSYSESLKMWQGKFASRVMAAPEYEDLELLCDLFYLPFEYGSRGQELMERISSALVHDPEEPVEEFLHLRACSRRFEQLFKAISQLSDRQLCHALYRHVMAIKAELGLVVRYLSWQKENPAQEVFISRDHRPRLFRGGAVARIRNLLPMDELGGFRRHPLGGDSGAS